MFAAYNPTSLPSRKMTDAVEPFITARRAYLALIRAEKRLYAVAQARLPKSDPLFKSIVRFCHNNALRRIRSYSDEAICKSADLLGDDIFRGVVVDGVRIPAVTHFFYGVSTLVPEDKFAWDRTRKLTTSDLQLFEQVHVLGRRFVECASVLPHISKTAILNESRRFEKAFERVRCHLARSSPLYTGFICLSERLAPGVTHHILSFCD